MGERIQTSKRERMMFVAVGLMSLWALFPDLSLRKWWDAGLDVLFLAIALFGAVPDRSAFADTERDDG